MRIFAVIVGVLAAALGCAGIVSSSDWSIWQIALSGWMPLFAGGGLALYALFKGRDTAFHRAAKTVVWFLLAGFAVYLAFIVYLLFAYPVH